MKKLLSVFFYIILVLFIFLPAGSLTADFFGYVFIPFNYIIPSVVTALVSLAAVMLVFLGKEYYVNKFEKILLAVFPLLAMINWAFYLFKSDSALVTVFMLISFVCTIALSVKLAKPLALKIVGLALSYILTVPVALFTFLWLTFGQIGENSAARTIPSPDGKYYAKVTVSDQGALGGDTTVFVQEDREINGIIFKIRKKPKRIYTGGWGEYLSVYWQDENSLMIDSKEYTIE